MKPTQSAKKTKGVGKRASKDDLAPRKSQDVKGGSFWAVSRRALRV
jgi:hypothetical protein